MLDCLRALTELLGPDKANRLVAHTPGLLLSTGPRVEAAFRALQDVLGPEALDAVDHNPSLLRARDATIRAAMATLQVWARHGRWATGWFSRTR